MSKRSKKATHHPTKKAFTQAIETRENSLFAPASVFHRLPGVFRNHFDAFKNNEVFKNEQFREFEDRRFWTPDRNVFHSIEGKLARYGRNDISSPPMQTYLQNSLQSWPMRVHFYNPEKTLVCRRREIRRRALFGLRKIGRGKKGGFNKPRWSASSYLVCKKV